jgi:Cdc6-like AAA superfamily ATPase
LKVENEISGRSRLGVPEDEDLVMLTVFVELVATGTVLVVLDDLDKTVEDDVVLFEISLWNGRI